MALLAGRSASLSKHASFCGAAGRHSAAIRPFRPTLQQRIAAASVDAATPAAEPAAAPAATPAGADSAEPQQPAKQQTRRQPATDNWTWRSNGSSPPAAADSDAVTTVRIAAESNTTKVASYIMSRYREHGHEHTVLLQAVGAAAYTQALKSIARLQQMVAGEAVMHDRIVSFKPRSSKPRLTDAADSGSGSGEPRVTRGMLIVVSLGSRDAWPDAAAAADDGGSSGEQRWASSPSTVRPSPNPEDEVARVGSHILRCAQERNTPARFVLTGNRQKMAAAALTLFRAVDGARTRALTAEDDPCEFECAIAAESYTRELPARSGRSGQPAAEASEGSDAPEGVADAAAAVDASDAAESEPAATAAAAAEEGGGDAAAGMVTVQRVRYLVTVQRCAPSKNALKNASRLVQSRAQQPPGEGSGSRAAAGFSRTRPGFIEVREEEWNQLKEQLAVVPHLTEQLQIMTRQHEQLLTLLAAQQGGQQQQQE